jgi:hypothetical protein
MNGVKISTFRRWVGRFVNVMLQDLFKLVVMEWLIVKTSCRLTFVHVSCILERPVPLAKCYHVLNWFFFPKPGFLEFIWIFSCRNHLKVNISHTLNANLTKEISLNPAHQDRSNHTKGTFHFLQKFQLQFNLIYSEEIIQYSRTFAPRVTSPNVMEPSPPFLDKRFPKTLRTWSEASWFGGSHNKKQNKLPSFIDRYAANPKHNLFHHPPKYYVGH